MAELAGLLYGVLLAVFLLITLPTLGLIPPVLPDRVLLLLKAAVTLVLIIAVVGVVFAAGEELWLAARRLRVRRRRARARGLIGGDR